MDSHRDFEMKSSITNKLKLLAADERGSVSAMSTIFLTVLLALGIIVGLVLVRDHIVQEMGDVGVALDNLDQSFSYAIAVKDELCVFAQYVDDVPTLEDPVDAPPACMVIDSPPNSEDGMLPPPSGEFP